jgi:arylformamidase
VSQGSSQPQIIDISPEISSELAVFPGDTVFSQTVLFDCKKGDGYGLSSFTTTPHLGAHTDAPNHYGTSGVGISERSLNYYYGPCQVIEVKLKRGERIRPEHVADHHIRAARVLFKTGSFPNPNQWNDDFNALTPELIDELARHGVVLVGIDTPSIDSAGDKVLNTHHAVLKHNMAILEGIVLDNVKEGCYTLSALPLKMKGLDASPVRAVLIDDHES